jgi:ATP-dependent DNA helicase RecG
LAFLIKYDLIRDNKLTNAAYLLFKEKDSVDTTIKLGRFQDEITIKDSVRSKSDVLAQIEEVIGFVRKHINKEVLITSEAKNIQKWQYPLEAIREIVINMILHRDYRSSSDSIVKVFNDRIEFFNPGRLPDTISVEDLLSNNYRSTPRNKVLADFAKDMGLIEKYGSGIQRILNYFSVAGLPVPEFRNISDGFMVTVFSGLP